MRRWRGGKKPTWLESKKYGRFTDAERRAKRRQGPKKFKRTEAALKKENRSTRKKKILAKGFRKYRSGKRQSLGIAPKLKTGDPSKKKKKKKQKKNKKKKKKKVKRGSRSANLRWNGY